MSPLDRRCRRLARVYPDPARAAEVATTLAESSTGRGWPRVGDAADVLWHGVVARLRGTGRRARSSPWADAASVAVVLALVVQAAVAVAVATRAFDRPPSRWTGWEERPYPWERITVLFVDGRQSAVVLVLAALATAAAVAGCLGRVRTARACAALVPAGVAGFGLLARHTDPFPTSFGSPYAVLGGVAVLALPAVVLGTRVIARASAVVPRWWWAVAATTAGASALAAVRIGPHPFGFGRSSVVLAAYVVAALTVLAVAAPVTRHAPVVFAGAALVSLPAMPGIPVMKAGSYYGGWTTEQLAAAAVVGGGVALVLARGAVRRARR